MLLIGPDIYLFKLIFLPNLKDQWMVGPNNAIVCLLLCRFCNKWSAHDNILGKYIRLWRNLDSLAFVLG
jgi:hypothetical protein